MTIQILHFNPSVHLRGLFRKNNDQDPSYDFHALVISVKNSALVVIFRGKQIQGSAREGQFMFPSNISVEATSIDLSKSLIPHFSSITRASFTGSYSFAAFHVTPNAQPDSSYEAIESAFQRRTTAFYKHQFAFARIEDKWVDFNHLSGLKFCIKQPLYLEIRAHERNPKLLDLQTSEINELASQIQLDRTKQLQLIDCISDLTTQKTDRERQSQDCTDLNQQIATLNAEHTKMKEALKKKIDEYSKLVQTPPVHAATGPVLRALSRLSITRFQEAGEHLATALEAIRNLNSDFLQAQEGFLHNNPSSALRNRRMNFFRQCIVGLKVNYVHIALNIPHASRQSIAQDRLKQAQEDFDVLDQSIQLLDQFESQLTSFPRAAQLLSGARTNFRTQILQEIQRREKALDSFILSAIGDSLKLDPNKYLPEALIYYFELRTIFDNRLQELGLIDTGKEGEERYLTPLDYSKERATLDTQIHLLSYVAFTTLLETDTRHSLLSILGGEMKTKLPRLYLIDILKAQVTNLFKPYSTKIQRVLDTHSAFEQLISSNDSAALKQKWLDCKQAILQLLAELPSAPFDFQGSYDDTLKILLKALPTTSDADRKKVADLKKELKNSSDWLKIGDLATTLLSLSQNTHETTALLSHLKAKSLLFLRSILREFPKLKLRHWVLKRHEQQLAIKTHFYWPKQQAQDPYYMANESHIPL